ncbi:hypothetical protein [Peribacillus butanolivorans]|uniref:hypothetical protein n=1 Tax=Peribacillus butanolivorans TaxID=421767 RepID=UPI001145EAB5|nr:hypothetical protein [Peribacillus butanolivorans]
MTDELSLSRTNYSADGRFIFSHGRIVPLTDELSLSRTNYSADGRIIPHVGRINFFVIPTFIFLNESSVL